MKLRLADDRVVERDVGEVGVEVKDYTASATTAVFGGGDACLLGAVTMEQLGLAPNPVARS